MKRNISLLGKLMAVTTLLSGLMWSCIKDKSDDCYTSYQLVVKTVEADSVGKGDIGEVILFVFDKEQKYLGSLKTNIDEITELPYPSNDQLYIIAWGNTAGGNQSLFNPTSGNPPEGVTLELKKNGSYTISPNDLFQGAKAIDQNTSTPRPDILYIKRKVANVTIIAKGLQAHQNTTDQNFTYVVRGTNDALDLNGRLTGEETNVQPTATFNTMGEFNAPAFSVFPSNHLAIDIYKGDQLVYSVDKDDAGNPFAVPEGKKLTIIIDFSGNVNVTITLTDWEEKDVVNET